MKTKRTSSDLESQGFKLRASKTVAKGSSSYIDESGRMHFIEKAITGAPAFVKKELGANNNGEKTELEFTHNTKVWEREVESPNTNGVIKEREVVVEQSHTVGDGDEPSADTSDNGNSVYRETTEIPNGGSPSGLQVLKNFVDHLSDRVEKLDTWTKVALVGVGAALVLAIVALAAISG